MGIRTFCFKIIDKYKVFEIEHQTSSKLVNYFKSGTDDVTERNVLEIILISLNKYYHRFSNIKLNWPLNVEQMSAIKKNQSGTGSAPLESYRRGQGMWADSHIRIFLISVKSRNTNKMFPKYNNLKMVPVGMKWSEVAQSCPTLWDPMDCIAYQAPPSVGIRAPKRQAHSSTRLSDIWSGQSSACSLKMEKKKKKKKPFKRETQAQEWQLAQELLLYFLFSQLQGSIKGKLRKS